MLIEEKGLQKYIKGQQVQFSEFQRHKISLLIHYDSTECSTCLVNHLTDMEDLFIISSNTNFEFLPHNCVFAFSPHSMKNWFWHYATIVFSYPIYIDRSNSIRRNNPVFEISSPISRLFTRQKRQNRFSRQSYRKRRHVVAIPKDARQYARQRRALRPRITAPERIRYDTLIPAACIAALLLIACGRPPKPAARPADANLATSE